MLKHLNTGYVDEVSDAAIMDRWLVTRRYMYSWFWPDLFSSIPIDLLFNDAAVKRRFKSGKVLKLLR